MTTALTPERYRALIETDTARLLRVAERGLDAPVPSCPGWKVADLLDHVAHVYEHKVVVMSTGAWPQQWPPAALTGREPVRFLRDATEHLLAEFARHRPDEPTVTFGDDKTVTFWLRRMALEIAVHRLDGELAHGVPTPIDRDLALDGVDEFLRVMLPGDWTGETEHPVDAGLVVESGGVRWAGRLTGGEVGFEVGTVGARGGAGTPDSAGSGDVRVEGEPPAVFRWMWGRASDDEVTTEGRPELVAEVKARLVEAAQ
jgi:uncharacterized protein (TIGR03083 family)